MSSEAASAVSSNDPTCWSLEDVGNWLRHINLAQYVQKFHENEIDGSILMSDGLDDSAVKDLISSIKHRVTFNTERKKLLESVKNASNTVKTTTITDNAGIVTSTPMIDQYSSGSSLQDQVNKTNPDEERIKYMDTISKDYEKHGQYKVARADHKNIMFIGRTRTGKSTIKSLLVDPTSVPDEASLKSGTKEPLFESFHVSDNRMVLNIIDTPGLFERGSTEVDIRDNETILRTIEICANREITKFHVVCFCVAITIGINEQDIQSLKLLVKFLGKEISRNSCLLITHCESKNETQRDKMIKELNEDAYFKEVAPFFQLGVLFSGSLNRDDYNNGNANLVKQFVTISKYRQKLIELFTSKIDPFPISEMVISAIQRSRNEATITVAKLEEMKTRLEEKTTLIQSFKAAQDGEKRDAEDIIAALLQSIEKGHAELARLRSQEGIANRTPNEECRVS